MTDSKYLKNIELFKKNLKDFFKSFESWKARKTTDPKYRREDIGTGEYLVDIKSLRRPASDKRFYSLNLGTLKHPD